MFAIDAKGEDMEDKVIIVEGTSDRKRVKLILDEPKKT